jgi:hypothetical protein
MRKAGFLFPSRLEFLDTHRPDAFRIQHFAPPAAVEDKQAKSLNAKDVRDDSVTVPPITVLHMFRSPLLPQALRPHGGLG